MGVRSHGVSRSGGGAGQAQLKFTCSHDLHPGESHCARGLHVGKLSQMHGDRWLGLESNPSSEEKQRSSVCQGTR